MAGKTAEATAGIQVSVEGTIARITFDNPVRHNAITPGMARDTMAALERLAADPDVRLLCIIGAGRKAFVSGADIEELERSGPDSAADHADFLALFETLRVFRKPTIALIRGYCFGAGVALALACDLRLAAAGAQFSIPAARLGIAYPANFTRWLVEVAGVAKAKEFLLTGRRYDANEASEFGLVHKVLPFNDFELHAAEYCRHLSFNAPLSMQAAKAIVNEVARGAAADLALCRTWEEICAASEDHAEGRRAFLEKRVPVFTGT
jgi:enoyl-CoA hydratase